MAGKHIHYTVHISTYSIYYTLPMGLKSEALLAALKTTETSISLTSSQKTSRENKNWTKPPTLGFPLLQGTALEYAMHCISCSVSIWHFLMSLHSSHNTMAMMAMIMTVMLKFTQGSMICMLGSPPLRATQPSLRWLGRASNNWSMVYCPEILWRPLAPPARYPEAPASRDAYATIPESRQGI